jgi:superfamily II RNA helicase
MPLIEERYDQHKVDSLKRYLQREAEKGRKRDYEIIVDGFKVVSRTDDVAEFDDYEEERLDNTRNVTIVIYDFNANRNIRYSFSLSHDNALPQQPTNGLGSLGEVNQLIQQRLDEKDREYELKNLKERLEDTQQQLDEAEEYQETLKKEIEHLKANKYNLNGLNLVEIGSELLKHTISKNAAKSPVAAQLAGILGALNTPVLPQAAQEPEGEVTFSEQEEVAAGELSENQVRILKSMQQLEQAFNPVQLFIMEQIIAQLMKTPDQLIPIAELLNIKIKHEHGQI